MSVAAGKRPIDLDAEAALTALRRARRRAERVALATGTRLVQTVEGKLVHVPPPANVIRSGEDEK
jgi:hypothetical protein